MNLFRRGRFLYWLARELSHKYTRALIAGFSLGLIGSLLLGRLSPLILKRSFSPMERIGIVGEFTPTTLPASIQKEISFGLTSLSSDGTAIPALAQSWEATDSGRTYIFHLRRDVTWHNGKPVEASDVNYNIRNVTFTPLDAATIQASLQDPFSPFPTLVAKPIFQTGLRGFGPYKVDSIRLKGDAVQYLRLIPVSDTQKKSKEYRFYRTEALAITAFKLGDIDVIEDISSPAQLTQWGRIAVEEEMRYDRIVTLFFNLKDQRLSEKSFRQGLGYALPELSGEKAPSPISINSWAFSDNVRLYTPNPEQAKKLLGNSETATASGELTITTFSQYVETAQAIAQSWNAFGVKTTVKVENALNGDYQVLLSAQNIPPDPDQYPFWHSTQSQTNITNYVKNVKTDKLLEDGRREMDREKRKKIYADFQKFLVEDAPALFLYYPKTYTIRRG